MNELTVRSSERTQDTILVRHPGLLDKESKMHRDTMHKYGMQAIHQNAWKQAEQPIQLKDLDGFELAIPWRIGRTWAVGLSTSPCIISHDRAVA